MSFKEAIENTPELKGAFKDSLQALAKKYRQHIKLNPPNLCEGSVDIDTHLNTYFKQQYSQASRWDYVIGYKKRAYFVEFHPAKESNVKEIIKKLQWLKDWLKTKAPLLNKIPHSYHWIPGRICRINPESRYARQLKEINLERQGKLILQQA